MIRIIRALGIVATVTLVGYAVVLLLVDSDADDVVEGVLVDGLDAEAQSAEVDERRERLSAVARGLAEAPRSSSQPDTLSVEVAVPAPAIAYGSGELDLGEVRTGFDYAMNRVEAIVKSRKRITLADWDVLYREANDAFSALSIVLDAEDEDQRAELEAAHVRLKQSLRRVRVRGRKFGA